jgi:hypothetical protein
MSSEPKHTSADSAADNQYALGVTDTANSTDDCKGWSRLSLRLRKAMRNPKMPRVILQCLGRIFRCGTDLPAQIVLDRSGHAIGPNPT